MPLKSTTTAANLVLLPMIFKASLYANFFIYQYFNLLVIKLHLPSSKFGIDLRTVEYFKLISIFNKMLCLLTYAIHNSFTSCSSSKVPETPSALHYRLIEGCVVKSYKGFLKTEERGELKNNFR